ncbi:MAG: hypothetical protein Q8Q11_03535 [bacterium]|nr:hypothetical protein [bacterium]MDZ4248391.1 hypothetical protein [Patescibacteria group bacterium]
MIDSPNDRNDPVPSDEEKILQESFRLRTEFWQGVGDVDPDYFAPALNPTLAGGPEWPNLRQAYRKIKLPNGNTVIATDGLSDPFSTTHPLKTEGSGFGLEFYIETDEDFENPFRSWVFDSLSIVAEQAAHRGDFRQLLDELTLISMDQRGVRTPVGYKYAEGQSGALVGVKSKTVPDRLELSLGDVSVVSVTVLYPEELDFAAAGDEARAKLAARFAEQYSEPVSSSIRRSVV